MPSRVSRARAPSRFASCAAAGAATLLAVQLAGRELPAQTVASTISGLVHDSSGFGLQAADLRVRGAAARAKTNERGEYRLAPVPAGEIVLEVRRFGFQPIELQMVMRAGEDRVINVELLLLPQMLDTVTTTDAMTVQPMAEFEARRARYYGVFYTRQDIERRAPSRPSELLRTAPGVRIMSTNMGSNVVVMGRSRCRPLYWLDGRVVPMFELDHLATNEIQAIEVYRGPSETPPELNRMNAGCGVIAIWTRSTAADRRDAEKAKKQEDEKKRKDGSSGGA